MIFRIFIGVIGLLCAFLIFDSARLALVKSGLADVPDGYAIGPENADITLVEFLDYACEHCRDIHPIVMRALEQDGNVRYIPHPLHTLNEDGIQAADVAYAAGEQGKFIEAHTVLIENYRDIDDLYLEQFAQTLELDLEQLKADINDSGLHKKAIKNEKRLNALKSDSVPTFLINGQVLLRIGNQLPTAEELISVFDKVRTM